MSGLDSLDYGDVELYAEVNRLVDKAVTLAGGSAPTVGSPAWWDGEPMAKISGLLVLAEHHLLTDPHRIAAEQLRAVSLAISGALDWREFAERHVSHAELQRIRAELGPLWQPYAGGPVKWETGSSQGAAA